MIDIEKLKAELKEARDSLHRRSMDDLRAFFSEDTFLTADMSASLAKRDAAYAAWAAARGGGGGARIKVRNLQAKIAKLEKDDE